MSAALAQHPRFPTRMVQLLAMFADTASAQAAAPELESVPGVRWVRVVKPDAILRSVAAHEAHSGLMPLTPDPTDYVQKMAELARAERAGLLIDCDNADPVAVARALAAGDALLAFTAGLHGVRELSLPAHDEGDGPQPWRHAA